MLITPQKGNISTNSPITTARSHPFRPNLCSVWLKEWHQFLDFSEVKRAVPVPGCVWQHCRFPYAGQLCLPTLLTHQASPWLLFCLFSTDTLPIMPKKKLNKRSPLCSKNNVRLKGLKCNLYLQKRTAFIIAFLPSSTVSHCCSWLNSLPELHLWQLSKPWKMQQVAALLLLKARPRPWKKPVFGRACTAPWEKREKCHRFPYILSLNRTHPSLCLCQWRSKEVSAFQTSPELFKIPTAKVVMLIESRSWNNATQHMQAFTANQPSWNLGYWIFSGKLFAINPQHVSNATLPPTKTPTSYKIIHCINTTKKYNLENLRTTNVKHSTSMSYTLPQIMRLV